MIDIWILIIEMHICAAYCLFIHWAVDKYKAYRREKDEMNLYEQERKTRGL